MEPPDIARRDVIFAAYQRLAPGGLVVDADACFLDDAPLVTPAAWRHAVQSDRLGDVDGAFCVAWEDDAGTIHLARDAIGHRTAYYTSGPAGFAFASALAPLLDAQFVARHLALPSVAAYLTYGYLPGRATMVADVWEVLPGECVRFQRSTIARRFFWSLPPEPTTFADEATLRGDLRRCLESTMARLAPPHEPVAASLSGGIDSSLVVALAQQQRREPVHTFSITFGAAYRDELPFSSLVASHCGTRHHVVELPPAAIAAHLDETLACLDKPNGDPLTVPNALLFREMANTANVVLNGEGGDPCFGGPKNVPMVLAELYDHGNAAPGSRERSYLRAHLKIYDELSALLTPAAYEAASVPALAAALTPWFQDPRWSTLVNQLMAINVVWKGGHHILPKVDALSRPFGVRPRSPLFAKNVVEFSFRIPAQGKLKESAEKYLLKAAVADLLPPAIVERPKSGMLVPVEGWFQGPLRNLARERLLDEHFGQPWLQRAYVERLLDGNLPGLRPRRGVKIWLLLTLEAHLRTLGLTLP